MSFPVDIGYPFEDEQDYPSPTKLNAMTITLADATYLNGMGDVPAGKAVRCIGSAEVGIFKPDRTYFRSADGERWVPDTGIIHRHDEDTDEAGGLLRYAMGANISDIYDLQIFSPTQEYFITEDQGAGSFLETNSALQLKSGNVVDDYALIIVPGGSISWTDQIICAFRISYTHNTYSTLKAGIGMESVHLTEAITNKMGIEACDAVGEARTLNLVSADGIEWSEEPTSISMTIASPRGFRLHYLKDPTREVRLYHNDGVSESFNFKNTNAPQMSGETGPGNVFRMGTRVKNTTEKILSLEALRILGKLPEWYW